MQIVIDISEDTYNYIKANGARMIEKEDRL